MTMQVIKLVGKTVVEMGAGAIVYNIVNATTPENISTVKKVFIVAGAIAIASKVSDEAGEHFEAGWNSWFGKKQNQETAKEV